jgi:hypothetical protein
MWNRLLNLIFEASTREQLVELQREIVTFEGGRWAQDFYGFWAEAWDRVMGYDVHPPPYPPGGPLLDDTPGHGPRRG